MPIEALTIVFRFTLFGLLIYKITQLTKTHVVPFLKEELKTEAKSQTELLGKEKLFISTQHRLENQIIQQKKKFASLEKNALQWQQHLLNIKEKNERTEKLIIANTNDKRKIQQQHFTRAKNSDTLIPLICDQVAQELFADYSGNQGKMQLNALIKKLVLVKNTQ
jgi:hypothetical protein